MKSFDQSPLLFLQPQHTPQPAFSHHPSFTSSFVIGNGSNPQTPSSAWSNHTPMKSGPKSTAGRKRSRDEAAPNLSDDEYFPVQAPKPQAQPENEDEWEYGEGMTLIKRGGYVIEASSQTGTWAEEKAEVERAKAQAQAALLSSSPDRPILRAAKSQRLDLTATPPIAEESMRHGALITPSAPSPERSGPTEPTIDDFTRHLGIGWSLISNEEHIQAAVRGWTKFIENHYPVTNVKIALQSKGLSSYLAEASEGYFLFGEDLKQGRLVSTNLEKVWTNLRGALPLFDGEMVMEAGETPKTNRASQPMNNATMEAPNGVINGVHLGHAIEVEMDMS
ncbi:hypothetical protein BJ875DRAFT_462278 [Amylocarpus encephaloides]|uniref:Uncharacterized protein n=1 Tax=Amylocarpus encephaloides TaxID=45428 RepID=A0A9P7YIA4_9HELO|nr:hypothetical protein BJ875DRAFT_462278 [Amylocarpus encephaloides]